MAAQAAVVLAAGGGTRFAGDDHKLLSIWRGRPLVWWATQAALDAGIGPVWVVAGAVDVTAALPDGTEVLVNARWAEGQATSLQVAVAAGRAAALDALIVGLGDQPGIGPDPWRAVAAATSPLAVATYDGRRRNPVRLGREVWDGLPTSGDAGARVVMRERPELVTEVACSGNPADIDTVEDLNRWS